MDLTLVTTPEEFAALSAEWDRLCRRIGRSSVFLTHEWFDAAWQWCGRSAQLFLLCCREDGELVGILPLVRDAEREGGRVAEFLTVPDTQTCDLIAADGCVGAVTRAFATELVRRRAAWDVIRLRYLPGGSVASTAFANALAARGLRCSIRETTANPLVALDSSWDTYYATRSRRLKKSANLIANRLEKAGEVRIEWFAPGTGDAAGVERLLDTISSVSARSWKASTGNSLDNPGPQSFIRRLSRHAFQRGWLSAWTLFLDGKPLAMEYQLVADGCIYALRSDFDSGCDNISPGSQLSRHLLQHLFGHGWTKYLMGPGENAYKYRWAERSEPVYEMTVYSRTLRGRIRAAWELALKPFARRLRDRLRPPSAAEGESVSAPDADPVAGKGMR